MKLKTTQDLTNCSELKDLTRFVSVTINDIVNVINSNLSSENLVKSIVSVEFTATDADTVVDHGLKNIPIGYVVIGATAAMRVYNGTKAFTDQTITLKSDAVGTATVFIFI